MVALLATLVISSIFGAQSNEFDDLVTKTISTGKFDTMFFRNVFIGREVHGSLEDAKKYVAATGLVFHMMRAGWWIRENEAVASNAKVGELAFICARYSPKTDKWKAMRDMERGQRAVAGGDRYIVVRMSMFATATIEKWREVGNEEMIDSLIGSMNNSYNFNDASAIEYDNSRWWEKVGR
jgi:hypothetical protein